MNPDDRERNDVCNMCGTVVSMDSERAFGFGTENVLCAACAMARGGRYDEDRDVWAVAPDLAGLGDEAYGAAPRK